LGAGRLAAFALVMLGVSAVTWQASLGARNLGFGGIGLGLVAAIFTMILYTGYVAGIWSLVAVSVFVAAEIVLAALLGVRNRRRWRRVDWLDYRPPRPPALQALIAGRGGTRS